MFIEVVQFVAIKLFIVFFCGASLMAKWVKNPSTVQDTQESWVQSLGREDPLDLGNTFKYACLENFMDRRAWWATVHGVAQNRT